MTEPNIDRALVVARAAAKVGAAAQDAAVVFDAFVDAIARLDPAISETCDPELLFLHMREADDEWEAEHGQPPATDDEKRQAFLTYMLDRLDEEDANA